jgi:hypothetical protein
VQDFGFDDTFELVGGEGKGGSVGVAAEGVGLVNVGKDVWIAAV